MALETVPILHSSGWNINFPSGLPALKKAHVFEVKATVTGAAPKSFIKVYQYGQGRKSKPNSWQAYVAKVGHKSYPIESVTEHLMTRMGQVLGITVAESQLAWIAGQLRFLSKYFLMSGDILTHGVELFADYLGDRDFVAEVEDKKESRHIFTFQVVEAAMRQKFPAQADSLLKGFVEMLAFDAVVGNNDRHYFNWGIIESKDQQKPPAFSPVYDTARGMFWNTHEALFTKVVREHRVDQFIASYIRGSESKIGWDGIQSISQFGLVQQIWEHYPDYRGVLEIIASKDPVPRVRDILEKEFRNLLSPTRAIFVLSCFSKRFKMFQEYCC